MSRSITKKKKLNKVYAFVLEGETEYWYLQSLRDVERNIRVAIKPELATKMSLNEQFDKAIKLSEDYDRVFWILDYDVIRRNTLQVKKGKQTPMQEFAQYRERINNKHSSKIKVIINNPCLEFWLLLHFEKTAKFYDQCNDVIKRLKKYLPDYEKSEAYYKKSSGNIYQKVKPYLKNAIKHAKAELQDDLSYLSNSGLSEMFKLFEEIGLDKLL